MARNHTVSIDRPPMTQQGLIQAFSRTNRLFDSDKKYGNIVTFQTPALFQKATDDALTLYSCGGESWVKAAAQKLSSFFCFVCAGNATIGCEEDVIIAVRKGSEKQNVLRT